MTTKRKKVSNVVIEAILVIFLFVNVGTFGTANCYGLYINLISGMLASTGHILLKQAIILFLSASVICSGFLIVFQLFFYHLYLNSIGEIVSFIVWPTLWYFFFGY